MTSPLVPWNTCGAYMSGVLGVSTASYLPYCFFNLLSPILDVAYGYLGFKVQTAPTPSAGSESPADGTGARDAEQPAAASAESPESRPRWPDAGG